jgi:hypothetical protein
LRVEVERLWRELEELTLSGFDPDGRATPSQLLIKLHAHLDERVG